MRISVSFPFLVQFSENELGARITNTYTNGEHCKKTADPGKDRDWRQIQNEERVKWEPFGTAGEQWPGKTGSNELQSCSCLSVPGRLEVETVCTHPEFVSIPRIRSFRPVSYFYLAPHKCFSRANSRNKLSHHCWSSADILHRFGPLYGTRNGRLIKNNPRNLFTSFGRSSWNLSTAMI